MQWGKLSFARRRSWFLLFTLLCLTICGPAFADKRVALVVGNSAYVNVPRLANPANDARLIAETLRSLGFTLVGGGAQLDLDESNFRRAVQDFGRQLQGADVGLFYYAGHGVQVRGSNYLVPVGANPIKEADVDFQMLDSNLVLRQMESAGTKLNLVILDACRNNPFGGRGLRATVSGLGQMQAPEGTLISFATQPNSVALDGADGDSPYTKALAQTMRKPGLDIFRTFNEVGLAVASATGGAQQPWISSSPIRGEFFFAGPSPSGSHGTQASSNGSANPRVTSIGITNIPSDKRGQRVYRVLDTISDGVLNLRGGPGVEYPIIIPIPTGTIGVTVSRCVAPPSGNGSSWCEAQWQGKSGWLAGRYLVEVNPEGQVTFRVADDISDGILNMRTGPGTNYPIIISMPAGAADVSVARCGVRHNSTKSSWCEIRWHGKSGWASGRYLIDNLTGQRALAER